MENSPFEPKRTMQKGSDKHFFAAYLNTARHNVFITMCEVQKYMGKTEITSDDQIISGLSILDEAKTPDQALKLVIKLEKHFPFIQPMMNRFLQSQNRNEEKGRPQDYYYLLKNIFQTLNKLRNEFSHFEQQDTHVSTDLELTLNAVLDAAARGVKDRFNWEQEVVEDLFRMKAGMISKRDSYGREKTVRGAVPKPDFWYKFVSDSRFTEKGLAFFTCLFLEKKDAYLFLKQLRGFKDSREAKYQATFEAYCFYSIRMPLVRIVSNEIENALALDMLNELQRCPSDLFELLSETNKQKFRIDLNEVSADELEPEVVLKRKNDRFVSHILAYFDQTEAFSKLRFYLDLGNYHFKVYDKMIDKEKRTRRLTQKITAFGRLNEFQQLAKPEHWLALEQNKECGDDTPKPYIMETYPHYHLFEDNIGCKFVQTKVASYPDLTTNLKPSGAFKTEQPDFWMSKDDLMGMAFYQFLENQNGNGKRLSLPQTEQILRTQYHKARKLVKENLTPLFSEKMARFNGLIEPFEMSNEDPLLVQTYLSRKQEVNKYLQEQFKLDFHDVPDAITDYLMGIESRLFEDIATEKIEKLISQTERQLKTLDRKTDKKNRKNQVGRKEFKDIKAGKLGDFLAKDFLRFQPSLTTNGSDKITGLAFQVLQAKLAFYGRDKETLEDTLREFKLIDSENQHPFLKQLITKKHRGIISFYREYLGLKKNYLLKCLETKAFDSYQWLHLNKSRKKQEEDYIGKLLQNYSKLPVYMPRGMFIEPLKKLCSSIFIGQQWEACFEKERINTSFLIQQYFKIELNDEAQEFYQWERSYKIFNRMLDSRRSFELRNALPSIFLNTNQLEQQLPLLKEWIDSLPEINSKGMPERANRKKDLRAFLKSEKYIRHLKTQDMVLFLMAKDLLTRANDKTLIEQSLAKLKLKAIVPNAPNSILSEVIPFEVNLNLVSETSIDKHTETYQKVIFQPNLKIKNYGDFRRFLKDRRLHELLAYVTNERIERSILEKELEEYERTRIRIFKTIMDFEKKVCTNYATELLSVEENADAHTSRYEKILKAYVLGSGDNQVDIEKLKIIRNKFYHNEYPPYYLFKNDIQRRSINPSEKLLIATSFSTFVDDTYGVLIEKMN
jgi:hypothetical protein